MKCNIRLHIIFFNSKTWYTLVSNLYSKVLAFFSYRYLKRHFSTLWTLWATSWHNPFIPYANNKDLDQPERLHRLTSVIVVRFFSNVTSIGILSQISRLLLASVFEPEAGHFSRRSSWLKRLPGTVSCIKSQKCRPEIYYPSNCSIIYTHSKVFDQALEVDQVIWDTASKNVTHSNARPFWFGYPHSPPPSPPHPRKSTICLHEIIWAVSWQN